MTSSAGFRFNVYVKGSINTNRSGQRVIGCSIFDLQQVNYFISEFNANAAVCQNNVHSHQQLKHLLRANVGSAFEPILLRAEQAVRHALL